MTSDCTAEPNAQPTRPIPLPVVVENIPDELKRLSQWVTWKFEIRDGRWTKPPFQVDGQHYAKANDPRTWGSFEDAMDTYEWGSTIDGIGFEPSHELSLVFIDLDHCVDLDEKLAPWAMEIIGRFNTYVERSPIDGMRIIAKGILPRDGMKKGGIEVYSAKHYLTVTGQKISNKPVTIEPCQDAINWLLETFFKGPEKSKSKPNSENGNGTQNPSDDALLEKALAAKNGDKLKRLLDGDTSDNGGDDSAADLALCSILAFWTQDPAQVDRIFRRSGLMRDKWDSPRGESTYGAWTIAKALAGKKERYEHHGKYSSINTEHLSPSDNAGLDVNVNSEEDFNPEKDLEGEPEEDRQTETVVPFPEIAWTGPFSVWRDIVSPSTESPQEYL